MHQRTEPTIVRHVESLADARDEMKTCLRAASEHDGFIRIQWLGATMFNVWNTMEKVLDWLATDLRAPRVRFEVAMLDSHWLDQNPINRAWTGSSADVIAQKILLHTKRDPDKFQGLDWVFEIHRYAHVPIVHGELINGKYLFFWN
jgi:hypothetical protein